MKRALFLPLLAIFLTALSQIAYGAGYKKFTSEAGGFSIWTPVTLQGFLITEDTPAGRFPLHTFLRDLGTRAYMVSYCDYPRHLLREGPQRVLDLALMGSLFRTGSKLVSKEDIEQKGYPGEEVVMDGSLAGGQQMRMKIRLLLVKDRLYMVLAGGNKGEMSMREMDDFINSFDLLTR
jgi:hypothetical protein